MCIGEIKGLIHCGLVAPYDNIDLGQHGFRSWLDAWWHQSITWTNVDLSSLRSCGFFTWLEFHQQCLWYEFKNYTFYSRFHPPFPGANELMWDVGISSALAYYSLAQSHQNYFSVFAESLEMGNICQIYFWFVIETRSPIYGCAIVRINVIYKFKLCYVLYSKLLPVQH